MTDAEEGALLAAGAGDGCPRQDLDVTAAAAAGGVGGDIGAHLLGIYVNANLLV